MYKTRTTSIDVMDRQGVKKLLNSYVNIKLSVYFTFKRVGTKGPALKMNKQYEIFFQIKIERHSEETRLYSNFDGFGWPQLVLSNLESSLLIFFKHHVFTLKFGFRTSNFLICFFFLLFTKRERHT